MTPDEHDDEVGLFVHVYRTLAEKFSTPIAILFAAGTVLVICSMAFFILYQIFGPR